MKKKIMYKNVILYHTNGVWKAYFRNPNNMRHIFVGESSTKALAYSKGKEWVDKVNNGVLVLNRHGDGLEKKEG